MSDYEKIFEEEKQYLEGVEHFLLSQIALSSGHVEEQKKNLVALRKEMFAEGIPAADDYEGQIELNQYKTMEMVEAAQYEHKLEKYRKYKKIVEKPYFGRVDFREDGEDNEAVYIGYHNVMNDDTYEVMVYDWRAPISSIFYRNEIGRAAYKAPCGEIEGEVSLKRQYEIEKGELNYFFDCALTITDELLQQALGKNASSHMKNIVETIQKEQDQIIRDKENDLLIVQGVAGSGKTSIAMHRIAFSLYDRLSEGLSNNNIMIISPNSLFGEYISSVLPELGEENVAHCTMEEVFYKYFGESLRMRTRNSQLEYMITSKHRKEVRNSMDFKGSNVFITVLDRLVAHLEKELIQFKDVYFAGQLVASKEELRKQFLDNTINMSIGRRLDRIERSVLEKLKPIEKAKRKEIQKELERSGEFAYEEDRECNNRIWVYKEEFLNTLKSFTKVDIVGLYGRLFKDKKLFYKLAEGLKLPEGMNNILHHTGRSFRRDLVTYEDGMAILYLKLAIEGVQLYTQIREVLIDEAQDYYPLHYKVISEVFKGARYTVLGDICQTIEKPTDEDLYDEVIKIINPKKALKLKLTKSYRSSYEISKFNQKLRGDSTGLIAFERHDEPPIIAEQENHSQMYEWIVDKVKDYQREGFETTAIVCKSQKEVNSLYSKLSKYMEVHTLKGDETTLEKGVIIMPIYMAKGLEYDTVIVYEANSENYYEDADKQLLYIACTRALHRLALCYTGTLTPFLHD